MQKRMNKGPSTHVHEWINDKITLNSIANVLFFLNWKLFQIVQQQNLKIDPKIWAGKYYMVAEMKSL